MQLSVIFFRFSPYIRTRALSSCSAMAKPSSKIPVTPRSSASLVVVNSRNEILLVQRTPKATSFAGFHVFPGGNCDPKDSGPAMTAIRETFEESGLLLASSKDSSGRHTLDDLTLNSARNAVLKQETTFDEFLSHNSLAADINELLPFTQWVTPSSAPRRFHTHFFLTFLQTTPSSGFSSGDKQQFLPTPDGGQEVVSARFVHPLDVLSEYKNKTVSFMPPQYYILTTLADILKGKENTQTQRNQVTTLSRGLFGNMVINPRRLIQPSEGKRGGEHVILTYEGDETRGGKPGRLHRALIKGERLAQDITLQRNFDIFTEIEPHVFSNSSKL